MKTLVALLPLLTLIACSQTIRPTTPVSSILSFEDTLPKPTAIATTIKPEFYAGHLAVANLSYQYLAPCNLNQSNIIVRKPVDIDTPADTRLLQHALNCANDITFNSPQSVTITEISSTNRQASFTFTTTDTTTPPNARISVVTQNNIAKEDIDVAVMRTLLERLLSSGNITPPFDGFAERLITNIANDQLPNLVDPQAHFDVITQSVNYQSSDPNGSRVNSLSGLVAFPDTSSTSGFTPKDEIILLTHSTGITPSDREDDDIWYQLASILASRGYIVIAPDNFGRGTSQGELTPETYLQAKRTGTNAVDFVNVIIESQSYDTVLPINPIKNIMIMGYSQGGHTTIAAWQEILHNHSHQLNVVKLFAGGGPYNVYDTFRGIMKYANDSCVALPPPLPLIIELSSSIVDPYCAFINDSTVKTYAIKRILPPLLAYGDIGLTEAQLINGNSLTPAFASGFMDNEAQYHKLKLLLQLSSFTNIVNNDIAFNDTDLQVNLYHSDYDRLVVKQNNEELISALTGNVQNVTNHSHLCNTDAIAGLSILPVIGIAHSLCGVLMMNHVLGIIN